MSFVRFFLNAYASARNSLLIEEKPISLTIFLCMLSTSPWIICPLICFLAEYALRSKRINSNSVAIADLLIYATNTQSPPPPFFLLGKGGGGGVEPPTNFLKKKGGKGGGLVGSQFLEGGCCEIGHYIFRGSRGWVGAGGGG